MLNLYRGFKSHLITSEADFSVLKVLFFLFETKLTIILTQNSAFLYNYNYYELPYL